MFRVFYKSTGAILSKMYSNDFYVDWVSDDIKTIEIKGNNTSPCLSAFLDASKFCYCGYVNGTVIKRNSTNL